jgi:hypothetical protein
VDIAHQMMLASSVLVVESCMHTDDQLAYIEAFCAQIRQCLEKADFKTKTQIIQLLDISGKVAFEKNERILYLKCLIVPSGPQQVLRMPISCSSNTEETAITLYASP